MNRLFNCVLATLAIVSIAGLASVGSAHECTTHPPGHPGELGEGIGIPDVGCELIEPVAVRGWPTAAEVATICQLVSVPRALTVAVAADNIADADPDDFFKVKISYAGTADLTFEDLTDPDQNEGTPGIEALVVGTGNGPNDAANVICRRNLRALSGLVAPEGAIATQLALFWTPGPCPLTKEKLATACNAYNGANSTSANQNAHILQYREIGLEGVGMCGCPFGEVSETERNLSICDSSVPLIDPVNGEPHDPPLQGSCVIAGGLTALGGQVRQTNGTCDRILIGGKTVLVGPSDQNGSIDCD